MKDLKLYVVAEKLPYLNCKRTRFVGLLVYNEEYLRLYSGAILGCNSEEAVIFGVLKGMELLKEKVNIDFLTDDQKVIDTLNKSFYSGLKQKLDRYPGKLTCKLFSSNDPKGIFVLNELRNDRR
ncbi:MAG: hypothetical protein VR72_03065 [Clostridiaceae bacterium BRH_c20a]|nr:MAG: hypothetical protein VR72_03065 [Clostridiaceae bacterium BRH_c20a]